MATVTFGWRPVNSSFPVNTTTSGNQATPAIMALEDGSGYFTAWDQPALDFVDGRLFNDNGSAITPEMLLDSTVDNDQFDPSLATLENGNVVVTFTDLSADIGGDIRARLFSATGKAVDVDFAVNTDSPDDSDSDVAALADGGFVVSWTRAVAGNNNDIQAQVVNSDGSLRGGLITVDDDIDLDTNSSQVTGLANGNFVVVWEEEPVAGGATEVAYRIFSKTGAAITTATVFDTLGSINEDIQTVALKDGGFAVAYTSNRFGAGRDIVLRIFDADGTARTGFLQANGLANDGNQVGDQINPTLTVLSNGYIVVGWNNGDQLTYQTYSPNGKALGTNFHDNFLVIQAEIAGLEGGLVANVRESTLTDGDGNSIRSGIHAFVRTTAGNATSESLSGDSLPDNMRGRGGNDTLSGAAGDDTLEGGDGNDLLSGGIDRDTAAYATAAAAVRVDLALTGAQNTIGAGTDTLISIEDMDGSDFGDALKGDARSNVIFGDNGNDVIEGRGGNDRLDGGAGRDTASYASTASGVTVSLALQGTAQATGGAGKDTLSDFEGLIGSSFNDVLSGSNERDVLRGGGGSDRLTGADGGDVLDGGVGRDTLDGGGGVDWATYATAGSAVTVNLGKAGFQNTGGGGVDRLTSIENLIGSGGDDRLIGDRADNDLKGGAGNDNLNGRGGDDILDGGAGNDVMHGGAGFDTANYSSAASAVHVSLGIGGFQNTGGAGTDSLFNVQGLRGSRFDDHLVGSSGDNLLLGGGGKDTMSGGAGDDTLVGSAGADLLHGNSGDNTFRYESLSDSRFALSLRDLITGFGGGDKIDLSAIDADIGGSGNQAFHLDGTTGSAGDIGVRFDAAHDRTIVTLYVDNNATADAAIMLSGNHSKLDSGDFIL
jgi:Ca2+-binding RTX toxin-like protein